MRGAPVIEVNLNASAASPRVNVLLLGPAGKLLPDLLARL